jgi:hypothetical protein
MVLSSAECQWVCPKAIDHVAGISLGGVHATTVCVSLRVPDMGVSASTHISAKLAAIHRLPINDGTIPQMTAVGPPDGRAMEREAAMAVHLGALGSRTGR